MVYNRHPIVISPRKTLCRVTVRSGDKTKHSQQHMEVIEQISIEHFPARDRMKNWLWRRLNKSDLESVQLKINTHSELFVNQNIKSLSNTLNISEMKKNNMKMKIVNIKIYFYNRN